MSKFTRSGAIPAPTQPLRADPAGWAQRVRLGGKEKQGLWRPGQAVRYAYNYYNSDGGSALGPWWQPEGYGSALDNRGYVTIGNFWAPTLSGFPAQPDGVDGMRLYRQFRGYQLETIKKIPFGTPDSQSYTDTDLGSGVESLPILSGLATRSGDLVHITSQRGALATSDGKRLQFGAAAGATAAQPLQFRVELVDQWHVRLSVDRGQGTEYLQSQEVDLPGAIPYPVSSAGKSGVYAPVLTQRHQAPWDLWRLVPLGGYGFALQGHTGYVEDLGFLVSTILDSGSEPEFVQLVPDAIEALTLEIQNASLPVEIRSSPLTPSELDSGTIHVFTQSQAAWYGGALHYFNRAEGGLTHTTMSPPDDLRNQDPSLLPWMTSGVKVSVLEENKPTSVSPWPAGGSVGCVTSAAASGRELGDDLFFLWCDEGGHGLLVSQFDPSNPDSGSAWGAAYGVVDKNSKPVFGSGVAAVNVGGTILAVAPSTSKDALTFVALDPAERTERQRVQEKVNVLPGVVVFPVEVFAWSGLTRQIPFSELVPDARLSLKPVLSCAVASTGPLSHVLFVSVQAADQSYVLRLPLQAVDPSDSARGWLPAQISSSRDSLKVWPTGNQVPISLATDPGGQVRCYKIDKPPPGASTDGYVLQWAILDNQASNLPRPIADWQALSKATGFGASPATVYFANGEQKDGGDQAVQTIYSCTLYPNDSPGHRRLKFQLQTLGWARQLPPASTQGSYNLNATQEEAKLADKLKYIRYVLAGIVEPVPIPKQNVAHGNRSEMNQHRDRLTVQYGQEETRANEKSSSTNFNWGVKADFKTTKGVGPAFEMAYNSGAGQVWKTNRSTGNGLEAEFSANVEGDESRGFELNGLATLLLRGVQFIERTYQFFDRVLGQVPPNAPAFIQVAVQPLGNLIGRFSSYLVTGGSLKSYAPANIDARMRNPKSVGGKPLPPIEDYSKLEIMDPTLAGPLKDSGGSQGNRLQFTWTPGTEVGESLDVATTTLQENMWSFDFEAYAGVSGGAEATVAGEPVYGFEFSVMAGFQDQSERSVGSETEDSWSLMIEGPGPPSPVKTGDIEQYETSLWFLPFPAEDPTRWTRELLTYAGDQEITIGSQTALLRDCIDPLSGCWRIVFTVDPNTISKKE